MDHQPQDYTVSSVLFLLSELYPDLTPAEAWKIASTLRRYAEEFGYEPPAGNYWLDRQTIKVVGAK